MLAAHLQARHFDAEHVLFRQGDAGDVLYIVQSGQVRIVSQADEAAELVVNQLGPGDVFGEMALLDDAPRSAGAVTQSPAVLLLLTRPDWLKVLGEHPQLALEIIRGLSAKLRFATGYIEKSIAWSRRIAGGDYGSALSDLEIERNHGQDAAEGREIRIESLIAAFFAMAEDVSRREAQLRDELRRLRIEIDESKKHRHVAAITETDSFRELRAKARSLRGKLSGESGE
ncbi:cyclic nucleotide-binding domain-containing protein [Methyloterricola oryzae]|uniref:cyclic nucleotide-binding domain-containing protein n=1 Tax=Methyloterricola oryzae TaxID=1495050 RepID=UPI000699DD59|nr:cyclic nucleotide-binding domain-containing protein [Methyloterricola oryzae]